MSSSFEETNNLFENPYAFDVSDPKYAEIFKVNYPNLGIIKTDEEKYNVLKNYFIELVEKMDKLEKNAIKYLMN
uniref:Uncharacterized protein n=1 Tax=Moumouvirus sp. 'Monve' TaxID=1128131 RepID=H2ED10_9VIRU|nr:hypothetical protein mv_L78 [Moumouvirus Monve]